MVDLYIFKFLFYTLYTYKLCHHRLHHKYVTYLLEAIALGAINIMLTAIAFRKVSNEYYIKHCNACFMRNFNLG